MKNVEIVHSTGLGAWRVPIHGLPPLSGWAVQYISGMDSEIETGSWMSFWRLNPDRTEATFNFEPGLHMCYNDEATALAISKALQEVAEIETRVVKI
jgi:hypothetical protein